MQLLIWNAALLIRQLYRNREFQKALFLANYAAPALGNRLILTSRPSLLLRNTLL